MNIEKKEIDKKRGAQVLKALDRWNMEHPGQPMSQRELARKLKVSVQYINAIINGQMGLSNKTANKIASVLGVDPDDVWSIGIKSTEWHKIGKAEPRRGSIVIGLYGPSLSKYGIKIIPVVLRYQGPNEWEDMEGCTDNAPDWWTYLPVAVPSV